LTYTVTGPFVAGSAPGVSAAFLNNIETWIEQIDASTAHTISGTTGTMTLYQPLQGVFKLVYITMSGFQASGNQDIALPTAFSQSALIWTGDIGINTNGGLKMRLSGADQNILVYSSLAAGSGSTTSQATIWKWSFGEIPTGFDTVRVLTMSGTHTSNAIIFGQ
jgi:hypothetical protein